MKKVKLLVILGITDDNVVYKIADDKNPGYAGNASIHPLGQDDRISGWEIKLGGANSLAEVRIPSPPEVVFSAVCSQEASTRALDLAEFVCDKAEADGIRVFNHPRLIRKTSRTGSAAHFQGFDRIVVPQVTMIPAPQLETIRAMFEDGEISYPSIIRTTADHNGENMARISDPSELGKLESLPFGGRDFYAIPFVDYASNKGVYRKFRLVKVGGKILPRHMISSDSWSIHSTDRNNSANLTPEARKEEKRFLANPSAYVGKPLYDQLVSGLEKTGLDYVAVDFSLLGDGRAVFFESNACFNAFASSSQKAPMPELAKAENRIKSALIQLVIKAGRDARQG